MSRVHAVAPLVAASASHRRSAGSSGTAGGVDPRPRQPTTSFYLERALILWPRLDRARLRKIADDPARIAELVERRTSQPFEVILAMLTRQSDRLISPTESSSGFDSGRVEAARVAIHLVRSGPRVRPVGRDRLPA